MSRIARGFARSSIAVFIAALAVLPVASSAATSTTSTTSTTAPTDPGHARERKGESALAILFGVGWYDNADFNQALVDIGVEPIETGFEYGLQFRNRVASKFSLGVELAKLDGRTSTNPGGVGSEFGLSGAAFFVDGFVHPLETGPVAVSLFAGAGPVFAIRLSQTFPDGFTAEGKKTGFGWHAGGEAEARFGRNFGFFGRGMVRRAGVSDIVVSDQPGLPPITFDADFDGPAVTFGPRWHFGSEP